jgi:hypothetical protein
MEELEKFDFQRLGIEVGMKKHELRGLLEGYNNSVGSVKEAYAKIITDKIWKLQTLMGKFLNDAMLAAGSVEWSVKPSYTASAPPESVPLP